MGAEQGEQLPENRFDQSLPNRQHDSGVYGNAGNFIPLATTSATTYAEGRPRPRQDALIVGSPYSGLDKFDVLPGRLRTAVWAIKDEGLRNVWHFFRSLRQTCVTDPLLASDLRLKQLRIYIENWTRLAKSLKGLAV